MMKGKDKDRSTDVNNVATTISALRSTSVTTPGIVSTGITSTASFDTNLTYSTKQPDVGLIAGTTIVAAIFVLVISLVIYLCCCKGRNTNNARKNSTYQMYSEVDKTDAVVPGHLITINSPFYGKEEYRHSHIRNPLPNHRASSNEVYQTDHVYEEINETPTKKDPPRLYRNSWI